MGDLLHRLTPGEIPLMPRKGRSAFSPSQSTEAPFAYKVADAPSPSLRLKAPQSPTTPENGFGDLARQRERSIPGYIPLRSRPQSSPIYSPSRVMPTTDAPTSSLGALRVKADSPTKMGAGVEAPAALYPDRQENPLVRIPTADRGVAFAKKLAEKSSPSYLPQMRRSTNDLGSPTREKFVDDALLHPKGHVSHVPRMSKQTVDSPPYAYVEPVEVPLPPPERVSPTFKSSRNLLAPFDMDDKLTIGTVQVERPSPSRHLKAGEYINPTETREHKIRQYGYIPAMRRAKIPFERPTTAITEIGGNGFPLGGTERRHRGPRGNGNFLALDSPDYSPASARGSPAAATAASPVTPLNLQSLKTAPAAAATTTHAATAADASPAAAGVVTGEHSPRSSLQSARSFSSAITRSTVSSVGSSKSSSRPVWR